MSNVATAPQSPARRSRRRRAGRARFERRFSFHALRHTACSNLYRRTRDMRLTQRFARHKSMLTTSIYAHPSDEDLVRTVRDLSC